jgi:outer membrane receptor protein involved in Fe transport
MNASGIRNQGWEFQGSILTGPFTTRGTYSWVKSRSMGVTPGFAAAYAPLIASSPQFVQGASLQLVPEHTWGLHMSYARAQTTVALNLTGVAKVKILEDDLFLRHLDPGVRLENNSWNVAQKGSDLRLFFYDNYNDGYVTADLTASHRMTRHVETVLEVQNLGNRYQQDVSVRQATIGRQTRLGFRIRS